MTLHASLNKITRHRGLAGPFLAKRGRIRPSPAGFSAREPRGWARRPAPPHGPAALPRGTLEPARGPQCQTGCEKGEKGEKAEPLARTSGPWRRDERHPRLRARGSRPRAERSSRAQSRRAPIRAIVHRRLRCALPFSLTMSRDPRSRREFRAIAAADHRDPQGRTLRAERERVPFLRWKPLECPGTMANGHPFI